MGAESSSESTELAMEEGRRCTACGAGLAGPFEPELGLTMALPGQEPAQEVTVMARAWLCPGCGLTHWYAHGQDLKQLAGVAGLGERVEGKPGSSYERRMQMLRMLRRVRRM